MNKEIVKNILSDIEDLVKELRQEMSVGEAPVFSPPFELKEGMVIKTDEYSYTITKIKDKEVFVHNRMIDLEYCKYIDWNATATANNIPWRDGVMYDYIDPVSGYAIKKGDPNWSCPLYFKDNIVGGSFGGVGSIEIMRKHIFFPSHKDAQEWQDKTFGKERRMITEFKEGEMIAVSNNGKRWKIREHILTEEKKEYKFICQPEDNEEQVPTGWKYAKQLTDFNKGLK